MFNPTHRHRSPRRRFDIEVLATDARGVHVRHPDGTVHTISAELLAVQYEPVTEQPNMHRHCDADITRLGRELEALTTRLAAALAEIDSLSADATAAHHAAADRRESHAAARWLGRAAAYALAAETVRGAMSNAALDSVAASPT